MANTKTFVPAAIASWFPEDLQTLKTMAADGASVEAIANALGRTPAAVRNKAGLHGISLSCSRPRAPAFVTAVADVSSGG